MSSNDIYTKYNIDKSKLKRDYIKEPLQKIYKSNSFLNFKWELPSDDDIKYLYIDLNLSLDDLVNIFKINKISIRRQIYSLNIIKSKELKNIKRKETTLSKYNVENIYQLKSIQEKQKQSVLKKYGDTCYQHTDDFNNKSHQIAEKIFQTRKKNKTTNTSQNEIKIYQMLCKKFDDVKTQYKSKLYPFACDFYIPSIDTYIEYQGIWTHGKEPYIGTDEQNKILEKWRNKNTIFYNNAIHNWTISDTIKRKTAKDNNLNWIEFFNMNQFMEWFNKQ